MQIYKIGKLELLLKKLANICLFLFMLVGILVISKNIDDCFINGSDTIHLYINF